MIASLRCPDPDQLRLYLLSRLDDADVATLEEHFSGCDRCAESLDLLAESDTLTLAMRQHSAVGSDPEPDEVIALVERLRDNPPFVLGSGSGSDTTDWNATPGADDGGQSTEITQEALAFLAPALAPDELGRLGPYRVLALLGSGGMGMVFRAEDPHLKRTIALKAMKRSLSASDAARNRFLREARTLAALEHDHVVTIHQAGEDRGILYLAMPLLKGESLEERLKRQGRLPVADALRIAREAALGLAAAHAQGVVHRDVKPANIWLEAQRGRVKLLDFGLARPVADAANLTQAGAITGTPHYMSPEQARGKPLTARSDLFSLGAVCYQMLAGRPPFRGPDPVAALMSVATETPEPPNRLDPAIPRPVSDLALRLLAKAPEDRPESALAVAETIAAIERDLAAPPPPARRSRRPILAAAAGVFAILAAILIAIKTDEGTIVLTVNEPDVSVAIDGTRRIAISSPRDAIEIRLASGQHSLIVSKDGFEAVTRAFKVVRGGKEELNVRLDPREIVAAVVPDVPARAPAPTVPPPPAPHLADESRPFVVLRAGSGGRDAFQHLAPAIAAAGDGEVIEVHGNGPFRVPPIRIAGKGLNLRAAPGYRPRFLPTEQALRDGLWFSASGVPVRIEGCDFQFIQYGSGRLFQADRGAWEIVNCRIQAGDYGIVIDHYGTGKLRIADCAIANGELWLKGGEGMEVDLSNNLILLHADSPMLRVAPIHLLPDRLHLRLRRNTIVATCGLFVVEEDSARPGPKKGAIEATENVFWTGGHFAVVRRPLAGVKEVLSWQGRDNLYVGPTRNDPFLSRQEDNEDLPRPGLAGWKELWGNAEAGSREAPEVFFRWFELYRSSPEAAVAALRRETERAGTSAHLSGLGPDWSVVGPGDAYLRAMAAAGRTVPADRLRREPDEGGSFVVIHQGRADRGHSVMAQAVEAAADGDVIEILGDGPFDGITVLGSWDRPKTLTVRAAPGYRPVLRGRIDLHVLVAFEGIDFRDSLLFGGKGRVTRLANCAMTGRSGPGSYGGIQEICPALPGPALEIVNSLLDFGPLAGAVAETNQTLIGCLNVHLEGRISIVNSAIGPLAIELTGTGATTVSMDHCVVWDAGFKNHLILVWGTGASTVSFTARDTLFEVAAHGGLLRLSSRVKPNADIRLASWSGARNVYRTGGVNFLLATGFPPSNGRIIISDLDAWRKHWGTQEEGSVIADPSTFDPAQWQLLPDSPGARAARDGGDLGVDVTRITRLTAAPAAASAAAETTKRPAGPHAAALQARASELRTPR